MIGFLSLRLPRTLRLLRFQFGKVGGEQPAQFRVFRQLFEVLPDIAECLFDKLQVEVAPHSCCLVAKRSESLEVALQTHPRVFDPLSYRVGMVNKEILLQIGNEFCWMPDIGVIAERGKIIGGGSEARILEVDDVHVVLGNHQVSGMVVAMVRTFGRAASSSASLRN